jgi:RNA polymerase sigma-70 factor (ECF subfamily)
MPPQPTIEPDSDEQLLARTARGDSQAFTLLFRRRQGQVYRFALHMTGATAIADDVTQDVFMMVMRDAKRYQPGRSGVVAWLCGIARNCALQRLDRERPFLPLDPLASDEDSGEAAAQQTDPLGELTRAEGIERVRRAVLSLPVRYREVVVLCDLQELSYAEAADALACAVGTVRSRLHRGRQLLGSKLAGTKPSSGVPVDAGPATESATSGEPPPQAVELGRSTGLRGFRSWA